MDIARRLEIPTSSSALDSIRPDILLFRAAARLLVLWGKVQPNERWIDDQIPEVLFFVSFAR